MPIVAVYNSEYCTHSGVKL